MNKVELARRLEEVEFLLSQGQYSAAVKKCDELNLEHLMNPKLLQSIAKAYEKCRRYVDAEDILLHARSLAPRSRSLLFHLCNVATKAGDIEEAKEFYQDFAKVAPEDSERFILQYRIGVALDQPAEVLIQILENMKEEEADDHWMYVLAQLYAKIEKRDRAIEVCDEIALWFNNGKYVKMAAELREQLVDYIRNPVTYVPQGGTRSSESYDDNDFASEPEEDSEPEEAPGTAEESYEFPEPEETEKEPEEAEAAPEVPERRREERPAPQVEKRAERKAERRAEPKPAPKPEKKPERKIIPDPVIDEDVSWAGEMNWDLGESQIQTPEERKKSFYDHLNNAGSTLAPRAKGEKQPLPPARKKKDDDNLSPEFDDTMPDVVPDFGETPAEPEAYEPAETYETAPVTYGTEPETYEPEEPEEPGNITVEDYIPPVENPMDSVVMRRPVIDNSDIANHFRALFGEDDSVTTVNADASAPVTDWTQVLEEFPDITEAENDSEHVVVTVSSSDSLLGALKAEKMARASDRPSENMGEDTYDTGYNTREELPRMNYDSSEVEKANYILDQDSSAFLERIARKRDEEQLFGNLPLNPEVTNRVWHYIVFGETSEVTLECAIDKLNEIGRVNRNCPKKVLKLSAKKIGRASIVNSLDRFLNNAVIVENSGDLSDEQLADFAKILDKDDRSLLIVFTDTKRRVSDILRRVPALLDSFTAVYEGKTYTARDLVNSMGDYLFAHDAKITSQAEMYVLGLAQQIVRSGKGSYVRYMQELADSAMEKAEKGGFLGVGSGKLDKDNFLIIDERHFKKAVKEKEEGEQADAPGAGITEEAADEGDIGE